MTVKELIEALQKMPQDKVVTIPNNDLYINGDYEVTGVLNWKTVEIGTDYVNRTGEEVKKAFAEYKVKK